MNAQECIKRGDLKGALTHLQEEVRNNPDSSKNRVFLFQLLAVQGVWNRALTQLNVAAEMDNDALLMAQVCRELLKCEGFREEVFSGKRSPLVFGEPSDWMATLLQGLEPAAQGDGAKASALSSRAFDSAPVSIGEINDEKFLWISDADMRIGPTLEAIVNGKYYWIPFNNISKVVLEPPQDLRDLVWISAKFTWRNEGEAFGFIPSRYTDSIDDDALALGRRTEWQDLGQEYFIGKGQRVFSTDQGDYPLLETRSIKFNWDDEATTSTTEIQ